MTARMNGVKRVKSVDGRIYLTDRTDITGDLEMRYGSSKAMGRTSAALVFKMEYFLIHGFRYQLKSLPKGEQDRVIEEYGLQYDGNLGRYFLHEDKLFALFKEKYPDELKREHISDYSELAYRATHRR